MSVSPKEDLSDSRKKINADESIRSSTNKVHATPMLPDIQKQKFEAAQFENLDPEQAESPLKLDSTDQKAKDLFYQPPIQIHERLAHDASDKTKHGLGNQTAHEDSTPKAASHEVRDPEEKIGVTFQQGKK